MWCLLMSVAHAGVVPAWSIEDGDIVLESAGCGCSAQDTGTHPVWMVLGLAGLLLRRRE